MTDCREIPIVPDVALHKLLDDLLAEGDANGGNLTPDSFWRFVAALARGRGIAAGLHSGGIDASERVPASPRATQDARQGRAYHAAVLRDLILGMGRTQDQPDGAKRDGISLLPGPFNVGTVASDLLSMLENYPGAKAGEGQILPTGNGGQSHLRGFARRKIVGVLHFRAARQGKSMAKIRDALRPPLAKGTWEDWQKEVGGPQGSFVKRAKRLGAQPGASSDLNMSDQELSCLLKLAAEGPGRREDLGRT